jgi:hypothetical protein
MLPARIKATVRVNRPSASSKPPTSSIPTSDGMLCWPVSARVGNVKSNDPWLIKPVAVA